MATVDRSIGGRALVAGLLLVAALAFAGCSEPDPPAKAEEPFTIALTGVDVNPNGTLTEGGLKKIQEKSGEPKIFVNFIRTPLTDAGLDQLAKFPNIKRVRAVGSKITPAGIEKFKKAVPEAEVDK